MLDVRQRQRLSVRSASCFARCFVVSCSDRGCHSFWAFRFGLFACLLLPPLRVLSLRSVFPRGAVSLLLDLRDPDSLGFLRFEACCRSLCFAAASFLPFVRIAFRFWLNLAFTYCQKSPNRRFRPTRASRYIQRFPPGVDFSFAGKES